MICDYTDSVHLYSTPLLPWLHTMRYTEREVPRYLSQVYRSEVSKNFEGRLRERSGTGSSMVLIFYFSDPRNGVWGCRRQSSMGRLSIYPAVVMAASHSQS